MKLAGRKHGSGIGQCLLPGFKGGPRHPEEGVKTRGGIKNKHKMFRSKRKNRGDDPGAALYKQLDVGRYWI
jgi:hypothetical protein